MKTLLCVWLCVVSVAIGGRAAEEPSELDALMARVLASRDANWRKLQQYVLEEHERFQLLAPDGARLYAFNREYSWFVRDGFFVRSPTRADGVAVGDVDRRRAEDEWLWRQRRRQGVRAKPEADAGAPRDAAAPPAVNPDVLTQSIEPGFVSAAYFLRFKFDPGQYALVGRERLDGRQVLRVEYYPTKLFAEGRTRPNRRLRHREDAIAAQMNKASLVTLWVDPAAHQILQYEFDNVDLDFMPGRSVVRLDAVRATMKMGQPFAGVWLPHTIGVRFDMQTALGALHALYDVDYHDYRVANVTTRIR